ncbi:hypothetical protein PFLUV_G00204350 [Perca fluviatilis]|uniref:Uncharacterized protein n=2 Tax=Perca fluviatilis TaxID=8168 RepID=A0A6A5E5G0_PERFL|nr:hypothetical protein PFLUV_G00204350 [Perca fluviatilis]
MDTFKHFEAGAYTVYFPTLAVLKVFAYYQTSIRHQLLKSGEQPQCIIVTLTLVSQQPQARPAVLINRSSHFRHNEMGNINTACQMSNYSKRNVRVYITEKALELDSFIDSHPGEDDKIVKFTFKKDVKDVKYVRVPVSQTQEVHWDANHFLSVFVEDENDENIYSKQIIHNMALSAPITVLLYDV